MGYVTSMCDSWEIIHKILRKNGGEDFTNREFFDTIVYGLNLGHKINEE